MGYTSYKTKTNKTKTQHRKQRVNLVLTIQRNWLHGIHKLQDEDKQNKKNIENNIDKQRVKLQDEDKQNKNTTQKTESQSSIDNTEKLATWDTQVTRRRQTKQKHNIENRESIDNTEKIHGIHKLQDEDKQNKNTTQKTESQSSIDNTEKLATWDTQVTRRRQTKQKHNIENRESIKN